MTSLTKTGKQSGTSALNVAVTSLFRHFAT